MAATKEVKKIETVAKEEKKPVEKKAPVKKAPEKKLETKKGPAIVG